ncbi:MAG TPA: MFS transporter [Actinomycetales bacterium]|jgi:DHA1 family inner membrane transport protein
MTALAAPPRDTTRPPAPAWLAITALAVGGFGIGTTEFATMGVLPQMTGDLGASVPQGGHLVSAYAVGVVVGAPTLAVLGARLPRKALLLALIGAVLAGNLLSALAPTFETLAVARFLSGLPHGAYFGIGAVVAASLVPPDRRARAVARMMFGMTVANIVGVPLATVLGQHLGWRSTYGSVVVVSALALVAIGRFVPPVPAADGASPQQELGALRRPQVWLTLLVGSVGFGGFFAVYSYITPTLTEVTGMRESAVPLTLALFGLGMTVGNEVGGRLADWSVVRTLFIGPGSVTVVLFAFSLMVETVAGALIGVFLIAATGSSSIPALQTRLMDVAGDAQSLAAAGNHAALNLGNAFGAFLGGLVISAGFGYTAPALVGGVLALGGVAILLVSTVLERRETVPA